MRFDIDEAERSVSFEVAKKVYSRDGLDIAVQVFGSKAEVYLDETPKSFGLTLQAKKKTAGAADLERLAGEFLVELLNQEYRFVVGRFNSKISSLIVTQALFCARGGETPPAPCAEEQTPEFKAETARLMKTAQDEIKRTMPKKLPPQGNPLPPAKEEALG